MTLTLASHRQPFYSILVSETAISSERFAAEELCTFLSEMTGALFEIKSPTDTQRFKKSIFIGHSAETEKLGILPSETPGEEDFIIRTVGDALVIAGGRPRGTLYGVYQLLEEELGCRWYTPMIRHIPKREVLELAPTDIKLSPPLEYREAYYGGAYNGDWNSRNRQNGHFDKLYDRHGGRMKYQPFVHTYDYFVPVEKHFKTNPEYFSLVNGERISERTQLCLTNPEVFRLVLEGIFALVEKDPDVKIVSVSANDWYNPCQCDSCKAIDDKEESLAGSVIWFVNKIAEQVEKKYPHIIIDTLAYQYTRKAPKHIKPRGNVCIRLCSIECCFAHPLEECEELMHPFGQRKKEGTDFVSESFQHDLKEWAKISDRVYIWDYVTCFTHYFLHFPNFQVLQANIQFLVKNSVVGIFEQGTYCAGGGPDFNELRTWLLAKLLWNPEYDVEAGTKEFMHAVYGHAAPPLMAYLQAVQDKIAKENIHAGIFVKEIPEYMDYPMIEKAEAFFEEAKALADNPTILWLVERAEMSVRFARLAREIENDGQRDKEKIDTFFADVKRYGLTRICEWQDAELDQEKMHQGILRGW